MRIRFVINLTALLIVLILVIYITGEDPIVFISENFIALLFMFVLATVVYFILYRRRGLP